MSKPNVGDRVRILRKGRTNEPEEAVVVEDNTYTNWGGFSSIKDEFTVSFDLEADPKSEEDTWFYRESEEGDTWERVL